MSTRMVEGLLRTLGDLRHEPIQKRVRALIGEETVVDSTRALVVWEPRRVVPSYAVPEADVAGELVAQGAAAPDGDGSTGHEMAVGGLDLRAVLDPSFPFALHTTDGETLGLRAGGELRPGIAFRPSDPDLAGHVILDFDGFDAWYEEDERAVSHARDPFASLEIRRSSRVVRVELDGELLAESSRARLLFESTLLPLRAYLPREDVRVPLHPSARRTVCAYKGEATYWSVEAGGRVVEDLAWSYEAPLKEAAAVEGLVAFFNERVDLSLDGRRLERPRTPWSEEAAAR
jgi:uncharacterized protein (DUF427 family)